MSMKRTLYNRFLNYWVLHTIYINIGLYMYYEFIVYIYKL